MNNELYLNLIAGSLAGGGKSNTALRLLFRWFVKSITNERAAAAAENE